MSIARREEQVVQMLVLWEEHRHQGRDIAAETLCAGCPELLSELERRIAHLRELESLLELDVQQDDRSEPQPTASVATAEQAVMARDNGSRYLPLRLQARGGLGEVFVARDRELERQVALKEIRRGRAQDPESRNRFLLEAKVTGSLEHPGIVPVYGLGTHSDGSPYYAMRLVRGESLAEACERLHREVKQGKNDYILGIRRLLKRFIDACNAVAYAHSRGVVHRDLKPANIMLGEFGETLVVDWGLAKLIDPPDGATEDTGSTIRASLGEQEPLATRPGEAPGTPVFMSPEQAAANSGDIGPACDIYSLGATLYVIVTGRAPFGDASLPAILGQVRKGRFPAPRSIESAVPPPLESVCLKAMALRPVDRYASALVLADDVAAWLDDEPVAAHRESRFERLLRSSRRHRAWVRAITAALAIVAVVSSVAYLVSDSWRRRAENSAILEGISRKEAVQSARNEAAAKLEALEALRESRIAAARLTLDQGLSYCEQGNHARGLLTMASGLRNSPPNNDEQIQRAIRANLGAWRGFYAELRGIVQNPDRVSPHAIAFSPDGKTFFTGGGRDVVNPGMARQWDSETCTPTGLDLPHDDFCVVHIAFSPDGRYVVTACNRAQPIGSQFRAWDLKASPPRFRIIAECEGCFAEDPVFSPNGRLLFTTGISEARRHEGHIREFPGGKLLHSLPHDGFVHGAAFSPDGELLLTVSVDKAARLWRVATGQPAGEPMRHESPLYSVAFSPDGETFAIGSADGTAELWNAVPTPVMKRSLNFPRTPFGAEADEFRLAHGTNTSGIHTMAFSRDGRILVTGSLDGTARLWNSPDGEMLSEPLQHADELGVRQVAFSPDGAKLLTSTFTRAYLWSVPDRARPGPRLTHENPVTAIAYSPDGKLILTGSGSPIPTKTAGDARLWDAVTGKLLATFPHPAPVIAVAFSPDGARFLTGCGHPFGGPAGEASLWDTRTRKPIRKPVFTYRKIYAAGFSPDGGHFVVAGQDGKLTAFEASTVRPLCEFKSALGVSGVAFLPDGRRLLVAGAESFPRGGLTKGQISLWDLTTGEAIGRAIPLQSEVFGLALSPDGHEFLTGEGNQARLWDTETMKPTGQVFPHQSAVVRVAFSPDGIMLLTTSVDGSARLWDRATGRTIGPPLRHSAAVFAAAFSHDGKWIATGGADRLALIRRVPTALRGDAASISRHLEGLTGVELNPIGTTRLLDSRERESRSSFMDLPEAPESN